MLMVKCYRYVTADGQLHEGWVLSGAIVIRAVSQRDRLNTRLRVLIYKIKESDNDHDSPGAGARSHCVGLA
jgi:hypothetical protein